MPLAHFGFPPHPGLDQRRHIGRVAVGIHGGGQISHIGFVRERQSLGEQLGCGLYEYIQIFVISNGTNTKYYSNSTRRNAEKEHEKRGASKTKTSNSFEFTCFWADANNRVIPDLIDFTKTFFAKHTILNILTKYCIFTSEDMLMVMRPYQITATERILNRITQEDLLAVLPMQLLQVHWIIWESK